MTEEIRFANFDIKQKIKAVVYTALLINFGYYIWLNISVAQHTLFEGSNLGEDSEHLQPLLI